MPYCPLSQYKNILGKPNEGVHSVRLLETPVVDYIMSIFLAMMVTWITDIPLVIATIVVFIVGITFHVIFGISTPSTRYLGLDCSNAHEGV